MDKPEIEDPDYDPEEEIVDGNWKAIDLPDQEMKSGEEETDEVYNVRAKLYRWRDAQWKERGIGAAKILKHKQTGKYNFMLRQESTLKIMAFSYVTGKGLCQLQKLETADKSLFWSCIDLSEGAPKVEKFCIRVKTGEELEQFKKFFELAYAENEKLDWSAKGGAKADDKKDEAKPEESKADAKADDKKEEADAKKDEAKPEEKKEDAKAD